MQQENERYYELAEKWLNGTITKKEIQEFSEWYNKDENTILSIPDHFAESEEELRRRIFRHVQKRKSQRQPFSSVIGSIYFRTAAAAVLIVSSIISLVYVLGPTETISNGNNVSKIVAEKDSVVPGGNKAVLVLGDGTRLILDSVSSGTIADDNHSKVIKLVDGQIACSSIPQENRPVTYNVLSTPRGGQYSITLVDGTRVWLNSSSSLRFPSYFSGEERVVELSGEGYFEVAPQNGKPFKVNVHGVEVTALGTHFNIMAYHDESTINTTLLEGSVLVRQQQYSALLTPGQQAQVKTDGKIGIIKNADTEQAVAWKNGVFNFNGSDIETTMRQIARWYDIEVIYEGKVTEHFNGTIVRKSSIDKVLRMLELTDVVTFIIKGRKIVVRS